MRIRGGRCFGSSYFGYLQDERGRRLPAATTITTYVLLFCRSSSSTTTGSTLRRGSMSLPVGGEII